MTTLERRVTDYEGRAFTLPAALAGIDHEERLALGYAGPGQIETDGRSVLFDMVPGQVDLALVRQGICPFLAEHARVLSCWLGGVVAAEVADGALRVVVRFARGGLADDLWSRLEQGFRLAMSIGIQVQAMAEPDGGPARVERWRLLECSAVVIGHDQAAHLRLPTKDEDTVRMVESMNACDAGRRLAARQRHGLADWQRWAASEGGGRLALRLGVGLGEATDALGDVIAERVAELEEGYS